MGTVCARIRHLRIKKALLQARLDVQPGGPVREAKFTQEHPNKSRLAGQTVIAKTLRGYKLVDGTGLAQGQEICGQRS
jgi:hypothetical protein